MYSQTSRHDGFARPLVVVLVILVLLIAGVLAYFLAWRPSDNDIQRALTDVSALKKNVTVTMPYAFTFLTKPGTLTDEITTSFELRVDAYKKSLASLDASPAIKRSASAASIYEDQRSTLAQYGESLASLSESVSAYGEVLLACNDLSANAKNLRTKADFDKAATSCKKAVADAESSPDETFNGQFFDNYLKSAKAVLSAVENYFKAVDEDKSADIAAATKAVADANAEIKKASAVTVKYNYSAPSSDFFDKLTTALNDSKKSLVR